MTVSELINELRNMPQDAEVHFSYGYGDHWHTRVAPSVRVVEEGQVTYSGYHQMDKIAEQEDEIAWDRPQTNAGGLQGIHSAVILS